MPRIPFKDLHRMSTHHAFTTPAAIAKSALIDTDWRKLRSCRSAIVRSARPRG